MLQRWATAFGALVTVGLMVCSGFCHPDVRPIALSALATGLAAFVGAFAAFRFEKERREKLIEDERYRELRFAHLLIFIQHQKLSSLESTYLSKWRGDTAGAPRPKADAWRKMPRLSEMPMDRTIELDRLAFILESHTPNLLHEIEKGQFLFRSFLNQLTERNELYRLLQEALSRLLKVHLCS